MPPPIAYLLWSFPFAYFTILSQCKPKCIQRVDEGGVTKTKSKTRRATSMNKPTSKQTNKQTNVHIIQFDNIINWRVIGLCVCRRRLSLLYVFVYNICSFGAVTSSHLHKIVWYIFCNQMNFKQQTHNHNKYVPGVAAVTGSLLLVAHPMPIVQSSGKFY